MRMDDGFTPPLTSQIRDVKICLLGDTGVGKSSVVHTFVCGTWKSGLESTIGACFMSKILVVDGTSYRFHIWDTAGQEKFRALAPMYYRGSAASIIVYDVTQLATFTSVKSWIHELTNFGPSNIVIGIAGNKCDLGDLREVEEIEGSNYASSIHAIFRETSAVTSENIEEMFTALARKLQTGNHGNMWSGVSVQHRQASGQHVPKQSCCVGRMFGTPAIQSGNRKISDSVAGASPHGSMSFNPYTTPH